MIDDWSVDSKIAHVHGIGNTNGSFNFLYFNAQSIRNKFDDLKNFLLYSKGIFHVIIINETWLKIDELDYYELPGYHSFHATRKTGQGGGVSMYINDNFDTGNRINEKNYEDFDGNNFLGVELLRKKIKILGTYRKPGNQNDSSSMVFVNELGSLLSKYNNAIVFWRFQHKHFRLQR